MRYCETLDRMILQEAEWSEFKVQLALLVSYMKVTGSVLGILPTLKGRKILWLDNWAREGGVRWGCVWCSGPSLVCNNYLPSTHGQSPGMAITGDRQQHRWQQLVGDRASSVGRAVRPGAERVFPGS